MTVNAPELFENENIQMSIFRDLSKRPTKIETITKGEPPVKVKHLYGYFGDSVSPAWVIEKVADNEEELILYDKGIPLRNNFIGVLAITYKPVGPNEWTPNLEIPRGIVLHISTVQRLHPQMEPLLHEKGDDIPKSKPRAKNSIQIVMQYDPLRKEIRPQEGEARVLVDGQGTTETFAGDINSILPDTSLDIRHEIILGAQSLGEMGVPRPIEVPHL